MEIRVEQGGIQAMTADAIIVNLFKGVTEPGGATGVVDKALNGAIRELISGGDLTGKLGQTAVLYPRGAIPAQRVIVVGLGEADEFTLETVREVSGVAIKQARRLGATRVATIVHGGGIGGLELREAAQAVVEGSILALYEYDAPRAKKEAEEERQVESLTLVEYDESKIGPLEDGSLAGRAIAEAVSRARTLVNQPSNVATPAALAEVARAVCIETGMTCRVLDEVEMRNQQMGLLLAVTQGATQPAQFIIMEHKPAAPVEPAAGPVVLVGKGVAFDTGGYSLKPSGSMVGMKGDMGGAAAVIGAMAAIARLNLPRHAVGLVPAVENVVSATSYKPNDVFIAKNGLSVEIISTDAEGRLILADALCYAATLDPSVVIDVATLTGGKVIALGDRTNALFVNDDRLSAALISAGEKCGEPLWRMPLDSAYDKQLKSDVADLKNTGGRAASSITAARFLAQFVGDWAWAHVDIAGSELYSDGPDQTSRSYLTKGGTAVSLRTLVEWLRHWEA